VSSRNRSSVIYTPQRVLNGRDYRGSLATDDISQRIASANRATPGADITLSARVTAQRVSLSAQVKAPAHAADADIYLAITENGLESAVTRGENRGKRLKHDFVLRNLIGPIPLDSTGTKSITREISLAEDVKAERITAVAFVEHRRTGDILQALALATCSSRSTP
jgi:hypothetical protein